MNAEQIVPIVSDLGFPIVIACILLYILYKEQNKDDTYVNTMIEALQNNTAVMSEMKAMVTELKDMVLDLKGVVLSLTRRLDNLEAKRGGEYHGDSEDTVYTENEETRPGE